MKIVRGVSLLFCRTRASRKKARADTARARNASPEPLTPTPSQPSSPNSSRYASLSASTQIGPSPSGTLRSIPPLAHLSPPHSPRDGDDDDDEDKEDKTNAKKSGDAIPGPVARAVEKVAGMLPVAAGGVGHELRDAKIKHDIKKDVGASPASARSASLTRPSTEEDPKGRKAELGQINGDVEKGLRGLSLDDDDNDGGRQVTSSTADEVIKAARRQNADVQAVLGGKSGTGRATNAVDGSRSSIDFSMRPLPTGQTEIDAVTGKVLRNAAGEEVGVAPENTGALMLDMSGYKVDKESKEAKEEEVDRRLGEELTPSTLGIDSSEPITPGSNVRSPRDVTDEGHV